MSFYLSPQVLFMLFLSIVGFNANAQELYRVSDYQLTGECENIFEEYGYDTFEIKNDTHSVPEVSFRDQETELRISGVRFAAFSYGLLFELGSEGLLYCFENHGPNFIVVESSERYMVFENGARQSTEAHIHSYISCGVNCGFARSETITFFDTPEVPEEEKGMLHSQPIGALYTQNGDTYPNEYPSRWYRSYLNTEERVIFDRIIKDG